MSLHTRMLKGVGIVRIFKTRVNDSIMYELFLHSERVSLYLLLNVFRYLSFCSGAKILEVLSAVSVRS